MNGMQTKSPSPPGLPQSWVRDINTSAPSKGMVKICVKLRHRAQNEVWRGCPGNIDEHICLNWNRDGARQVTCIEDLCYNINKVGNTCRAKAA